MMKLSGRTEPDGLRSPIEPDLWRVCEAGEAGDLPLAGLATQSPLADRSHRLYLAFAEDTISPVAPDAVVVRLPRELGHLAAGDIIAISPDGRRVNVLWKNSAAHNGLLLTEQCDNFCLMCSQPPKDRDDAWLFDRAKRIIDLLPLSAGGIGLTGGEPTLHPDALVDLLEHCQRVRPDLSVHLLSNGRKFADQHFAQRYARVGISDIMVGIPVYAPEAALHDYVVQAQGAFEETIHGILNLASFGQAIEIRVVVQLHTVPILADLAVFITRNLPFISQVALMGLEMTGLARPNASEVWIDPVDYQAQLGEATRILVNAGITTKIYNHQLCVLDRQLWQYSVRSISDWKNDYLAECVSCSVRDTCGGVFTTSGSRVSAHLRPIPVP